MVSHVDGNALAGPLAELFQTDMTIAAIECVACGDIAELAQAMVYPDPMGFVVHCASCEAVLMTLVTATESTSLDIRGIARLVFDRN